LTGFTVAAEAVLLQRLFDRRTSRTRCRPPIPERWSDTAIPPRGLPEYFDDAIARTENGASAVKLFMIPDGGHCGGGTDVDDAVAILDAASQWLLARGIRHG
jgi:hypothetical protein